MTGKQVALYAELLEKIGRTKITDWPTATAARAACELCAELKQAIEAERKDG